MDIRFKKILKNFPHISKGNLVLSICLGAASAIFLHLIKFQRNFFCWRYLAFSVLFFFGATLFAVLLNHLIIARKYYALDRSLMISTLIISMFLSAMLVAQIDLEPAYFLLPNVHLKIKFNIGNLNSDQEMVRFLEFRTRWGSVNLTGMEIQGDGRRDGNTLVFDPNQTIQLDWYGKVGPWAKISFESTNDEQQIDIFWNDEKSIANLYHPTQTTHKIKNHFQLSNWVYFPYALSVFFLVVYLLNILILLMSSWGSHQPTYHLPAKLSWLWFMLPMLICWILTLMIFWPGSMSTDSISQWQQALTGRFNNWHPAFHSMLIAMVMRIWFSPASVALLQISLLALIVAWGLGILQKFGAPKLVLWAISLLFAISPINNIMLIILWKDIPYAISLLWMSILILKIVLERDDIKNKKYWIILGVAGFLVSIFRKNGLPVVMLSFLALILFIKSLRIQLFGGLLVTLLLYLFTNGPLYAIMDVNKDRSGQQNVILLHHISAHITNGTDLSVDEQIYLEGLMPFEKWRYGCCNVKPISRNEDFDRIQFLSNSGLNQKIALNLFLRDPLVDIKHIICASDLVWRIKTEKCVVKNSHAIINWNQGNERWIRRNSIGLEQNSIIPSLIAPFLKLLKIFGFKNGKLSFILRPAFWLYTFIFNLAVLSIRRGDSKNLLSGSPIILQCFLLFLISFAPNFRYHFSVNLVGLFSLGWLYIGRTSKIKTHASSDSHPST